MAKFTPWDNPMGTDGFEFIEYAAPDPAAMGVIGLLFFIAVPIALLGAIYFRARMFNYLWNHTDLAGHPYPYPSYTQPDCNDCADQTNADSAARGDTVIGADW